MKIVVGCIPHTVRSFIFFETMAKFPYTNKDFFLKHKYTIFFSDKAYRETWQPTPSPPKKKR